MDQKTFTEHSKRKFILLKLLKIIVPPVLLVLIFISLFFNVYQPSLRINLLNQKKAMLTKLVDVTISSIKDYHSRSADGIINEKEAKKLAIDHVRKLRFGAEGKNYFWINERDAVLIMHPYRSDLEGKNVLNFQDIKGKRIFREIIRIAEEKSFGYVKYHWQWFDRVDKKAPKLSYVKVFAPWNWVVGTGVYFEDIEAEVSGIRNDVLFVSALVLFTITGLAVLIIYTGLIEFERRRAAENELFEYQDHLEDLVDKRTAELKNAHEKVKTLSGLLPICSNCKKIRDDKGFWSQVETYIEEHSEAEFSHSLCPLCLKKMYPGHIQRYKKN